MADKSSRSSSPDSAPSAASRPESTPDSIFGSTRYEFTTMLMEIHHTNGRIAEKLEAFQKTADGHTEKLGSLEKKIERYTHLAIGGIAVFVLVAGALWWAMGDIVSAAVREGLKSAIISNQSSPDQSKRQ